MKKTKFTESQIVAAIKKQESGISTKEVARELGVYIPLMMTQGSGMLTHLRSRQ
jgi:predicted transcriptional regulator